MATTGQGTFEVLGLDAVRDQLEGLSGVQARRKITRAIKADAQRILVPPIKAAAPTGGPGSPWRKTRGSRGGPMARKVTVRTAPAGKRKSLNEVAAVTVGPRTWYANFVVRGTRAHEIRPRSKRALHWDDQFASRVRHPGSKANPFPERAVSGKADDLSRSLAAALLRKGP